MKKWIVLTVVALSVTSSALAEGGPRKHQGPQGDRHGGITALLDKPHVIKKLGITDEQVAALKENNYATQKDLIAKKAERDAARVDLQQAMNADEVDEAAVMAAVEKQGALDTELHKARVKSQLKVIAILGKEKYDQLKTMQHMRRAKKDGQGKRDGKKGRRAGLRDGGPRGEDAPPWMQDEMPPPEDEE